MLEPFGIMLLRIYLSTLMLLTSLPAVSFSYTSFAAREVTTLPEEVDIPLECATQTSISCCLGTEEGACWQTACDLPARLAVQVGELVPTITSCWNMASSETTSAVSNSPKTSASAFTTDAVETDQDASAKYNSSSKTTPTPSVDISSDWTVLDWNRTWGCTTFTTVATTVSGVVSSVAVQMIVLDSTPCSEPSAVSITTSSRNTPSKTTTSSTSSYTDTAIYVSDGSIIYSNHFPNSSVSTEGGSSESTAANATIRSTQSAPASNNSQTSTRTLTTWYKITAIVTVTVGSETATASATTQGQTEATTSSVRSTSPPATTSSSSSIPAPDPSPVTSTVPPHLAALRAWKTCNAQTPSAHSSMMPNPTTTQSSQTQSPPPNLAPEKRLLEDPAPVVGVSGVKQGQGQVVQGRDEFAFAPGARYLVVLALVAGCAVVIAAVAAAEG